MKKVIVIGGGLGGLTGAVLLASKGFQVQLFERNQTLGGKMNRFISKGYTFDTGPSLITMPYILDNFFKSINQNMDFKLVPITPLCRYFYPDGIQFDAYSKPEQMKKSIQSFAPHELEAYEKFLTYSKNIYNLTSNIFLMNPIHELRKILNWNTFKSLMQIYKIDPFCTAHQTVTKHFQDPHLIQYFDRYPTYNGSSPYLAPATLNIIPYVELTTHYSKSFTMATRMLPKSKRWPVYALYGFCRFSDNLLDKPRERSSKEILDEINNLRHELKIAYRTGSSEHPVLNPFIHIALKFNIPQKYPDEFLEGVAMDLTHKRYKTFDELYLFCYRVAGIVGIMMTYVLGYQSDEAFLYAEKLGIAMQLTNILRDIQEDKNMERIYIPEEHWKKFNIKEDHFLQETFDSDFSQLMQFECDLANQYYKEAQPGISMLTRNTQFAIYAASEIYSSILKQVERFGYNPFLGRVYVPTGSKLSILFKEFIKTKF